MKPSSMAAQSSAAAVMVSNDPPQAEKTLGSECSEVPTPRLPSIAPAISGDELKVSQKWAATKQRKQTVAPTGITNELCKISWNQPRKIQRRIIRIIKHEVPTPKNLPELKPDTNMQILFFKSGRTVREKQVGMMKTQRATLRKRWNDSYTKYPKSKQSLRPQRKGRLQLSRL